MLEFEPETTALKSGTRSTLLPHLPLIQIIVIVLALVEGEPFCCCRIPLLVFRSGDLSLQPEHHPEVGAFDYISQEVAFTLTAAVLHFKHVDNTGTVTKI
jgi:hypothetical protein